MEPIIRIRNVSHYFGSGALRKQILFDVTADIFPAEILITTGPSGSGKTTLLSLIGGLRTVQEGSLQTLACEMNGASPNALVEIRKHIGFIFQSHNLLDALTASENVEMAVQLDPAVKRKEGRDRAVEMLTAVGLGDHVDCYPRQLSGGQKQRVAIARALVNRAQIVLADEPTASLDKKSGREVVEILHKLAKEQSCAILLVTHDNRILDIADRIMTLEDGRVSSFTSAINATTRNLLGAFTQLHRKGELVKHVASLSDRQFTELLEQVTSEFEQFLRATDLVEEEAIEALGDEVLVAATARIRDILNADRATLYLVDTPQQVLRSKIAHAGGETPLAIEIPMNMGIAGRVATSGRTMNISDAYAHPDFNPRVDRESGYRTRSILCMPVYDHRKRIFAVAQLLNRRDNQPFTAEDEAKFQEFAGPFGVLLESCTRLGLKKAHTPLPG
jgi:putative ABC transport system ATP-binding protein